MPVLSNPEIAKIVLAIEDTMGLHYADLYSHHGSIKRAENIPIVIESYGVQSGVVQGEKTFVSRSEYTISFRISDQLRTPTYSIDTIILVSSGAVFRPIAIEDSTQIGIRYKAQCIYAGTYRQNTGTPRPKHQWHMSSLEQSVELDRISTAKGQYSDVWVPFQEESFDTSLYPNYVNRGKRGHLKTGAFSTEGPLFANAGTIVFWARISNDANPQCNTGLLSLGATPTPYVYCAVKKENSNVYLFECFDLSPIAREEYTIVRNVCNAKHWVGIGFTWEWNAATSTYYFQLFTRHPSDASWTVSPLASSIPAGYGTAYLNTKRNFDYIDIGPGFMSISNDIGYTTTDMLYGNVANVQIFTEKLTSAQIEVALRSLWYA